MRRGARYLVVNGDDFGMSDGVSRGILEAHRRGVLTSTSLMVGRPASEAAAALASRAPGLSVGLHLELGDGALDDPAGAAEAQLLRFTRLTGSHPTHIDSHHDRHRDPDVLPHVLRLAERHGLPLRGHGPVRCLTAFYGRWAGESHPEQISVENLLHLLASGVEEGATELVCHPGFAAGELRSDYRMERETELETLCDPRIPTAMDRLGIRLVGFADLPARRRPRSGQRSSGPWPR